MQKNNALSHVVIVLLKSSEFCIWVLGITCICLSLNYQHTASFRTEYSYDETLSLSRIAGLTLRSLEGEFDGSIKTAWQIRQKIENRKDSTWADILHALADAPEHAPLYYFFISASPLSPRTTTFLLSCLLLPLSTWLFCKEYSANRLLPFFTVVFLLLSPILSGYFTVLREYSVFMALTFLSGWSFLRCMRLGKQSSKSEIAIWGTHAIITTLSIYTSLLSILTILSQLLYILLSRKQVTKKMFVGFCYAYITALFLCAPWFYIALRNPYYSISRIDWLFSFRPSLFECLGMWRWGIGTLLGYAIYWYAPILVILIPTIYFPSPLFNKDAKWFYLLATMLVNIAFLVLPDLFGYGRLVFIYRYSLPLILCFTIIISSFFAELILSSHLYVGLIGRGALILIFGTNIWNASLVPDPKYLQTESHIGNFAKVIETEPHALILADLTQNSYRTQVEIYQLAFQLPQEQPLLLLGRISQSIPSQTGQESVKCEPPRILSSDGVLKQSEVDKIEQISSLRTINTHSKNEFEKCGLAPTSTISVPSGYNSYFFYRPSENLKRMLSLQPYRIEKPNIGGYPPLEVWKLINTRRTTSPTINDTFFVQLPQTMPK